MSSRIGKSAQQAALVAVFLPSGHATRRVSAAKVQVLVNTNVGQSLHAQSYRSRSAEQR